MSTYSPDIGFTPSTHDDIVQRQFELLKKYIPHTMTFDEYLQSDLYLVTQGTADLKFDSDKITSDTINNFFSFLEDSNVFIQDGNSNTYSGLLSALLEISDNVFFINYIFDNQILPAEVVIVIENPDIEKIDTVMLDNLGIALRTLPAVSTIVPDITRSFTIINGQVIPYSYKEAVVDNDFYVKIRYRLLQGAIVPASEIEDITTTFFNEFNKVMKIGTKFERDIYVSTQNIQYVAEFEVGYNFDGGATYIYNNFQPSLDTRLSLEINRIVVVGDL